MKPLVMTLSGQPYTKKNSQRPVMVNGRPIILPSKQFTDYQKRVGPQVRGAGRKIDHPVNVRCLYYMPTRRRCDLVNLLEATCDILVHYGVLADDNCTIVAAHDGSRVYYDKESPRVTILIADMPPDERIFPSEPPKKEMQHEK